MSCKPSWADSSKEEELTRLKQQHLQDVVEKILACDGDNWHLSIMQATTTHKGIDYEPLTTKQVLERLQESE